MQLLKVGNEFDIKINKVNAKTTYIAEVRLVKGEVLESGTRNKVEKGDARANDAITSSRPEDKKPGRQDGRHKTGQYAAWPESTAREEQGREVLLRQSRYQDL